MLMIDYRDLDISLRDIETDYISEDRLLNSYETDQLSILKRDIERDISKTTDSEEQELHKRRFEKVNDILKIHENKLEQAIEYLKKPFKPVPNYPETIIERDYRRFSNYYDKDLLLTYGTQLTLKIEEVTFSTGKEEEIFIENVNYLLNALKYGIDLFEGITVFVKSDYPLIYRIMEFKEAISFKQEL